MLKNAYIVTGRLSSPRTIELDEDLPVEGGEVKVVVEVNSNAEVKSPANWVSDLKDIHRELAKDGYVAPTRDDVDSYIAEERASWGE